MPISASGMQGPSPAGDSDQDKTDAGEEQQTGDDGRGDASGWTPGCECSQRHVAGQAGDTGDERYGADRVHVINHPRLPTATGYEPAWAKLHDCRPHVTSRRPYAIRAINSPGWAREPAA